MLYDVMLQERPNMGPYPAPLPHCRLNEREREREREREESGREGEIKIIKGMFGSSQQQRKNYTYEFIGTVHELAFPTSLLAKCTCSYVAM